jgi:hypothetical protein
MTQTFLMSTGMLMKRRKFQMTPDVAIKPG